MDSPWDAEWRLFGVRDVRESVAALLHGDVQACMDVDAKCHSVDKLGRLRRVELEVSEATHNMGHGCLELNHCKPVADAHVTTATKRNVGVRTWDDGEALGLELVRFRPEFGVVVKIVDLDDALGAFGDGVASIGNRLVESARRQRRHWVQAQCLFHNHLNIAVTCRQKIEQ